MNCPQCGKWLAGGLPCILCSDTEELLGGSLRLADITEEHNFTIVDRKNKDYCSECGVKKKWVDLLTSRAFCCPKCGED